MMACHWTNKLNKDVAKNRQMQPFKDFFKIDALKILQMSQESM